ncbi:hypothetical protein HNQ09_002146 [Deinococcus budaensis]|uniref:Uncharacterized protein n=1 Tax=Deinococcus budaensis TaxID=1665626 RepID=A0A7W8GFW2_9DEIO|nr:hypothetical protein [Deinococcus budaensis]MBB5234703.1 hypothetical protein [Deinococcus budaensis]
MDVPREAADFVLLFRDLAVLGRGIRRGRVTFVHPLKAVFTTTRANFGNYAEHGGHGPVPAMPAAAAQADSAERLPPGPAQHGKCR